MSDRVAGMPTLRAATDNDLAFCESLTRGNMRRYLPGGEAAWDPQRFLRSWTQFENALIVVDGETVGLLRLLEVDGTLEIRDLQLLAGHRGRGIGTWAIAQAMAQARRRAIAVVRLRVHVDNPARRLYARLGFQLEASVGDIRHLACPVPRDRGAPA